MSVAGFTKVSEAEYTNRMPQFNPYGPNPADYLSNVAKFQLIESTLREGEQFANAFFNTKTKLAIAKALDDFGVDYIEVTSPLASEQSRLDCEAICNLGLRAKILTHISCRMEDAKIAVETGVDGVDIVIDPSQFKSKVQVGDEVVRVIEYIKSKGVETRFLSEDSFRSDLVDLLHIYKLIDNIGVDRVGIADTIGCANPRQVYEMVRTLKSVVKCEIECHFHNDTGCAIANAYTALEAGAKMVDVSVLGIGERNGITSLGGFILRMIAADRTYVLSKYKLHKLRDLENLVAEAVQVNIPFNNPITGFCAFTHKAGPHARAILAKPATYEILKPSDFGLTRYIHFANRLTGWSAIKSRVDQLNLQLTDEQCKDVTMKIKKLGDVRPLNIDDVDSIIKDYHADLSSPFFKEESPVTFVNQVEDVKSKPQLLSKVLIDRPASVKIVQAPPVQIAPPIKIIRTAPAQMTQVIKAMVLKSEPREQEDTPALDAEMELMIPSFFMDDLDHFTENSKDQNNQLAQNKEIDRALQEELKELNDVFNGDFTALTEAKNYTAMTGDNFLAGDKNEEFMLGDKDGEFTLGKNGELERTANTNGASGSTNGRNGSNGSNENNGRNGNNGSNINTNPFNTNGEFIANQEFTSDEFSTNQFTGEFSLGNDEFALTDKSFSLKNDFTKDDEFTDKNDFEIDSFLNI